AVVRDVIGDARRIDDPDTCEGQALLACEPRNLLGETECRWMLAATEEISSEQPWNVAGSDRTIGNTTLRGNDLHQGLEPEGAPRPVADQLQLDRARRG